MNASYLILNGDTPLSYVDPGVGRQMSILAYLTVGTLAVSGVFFIRSQKAGFHSSN